MSAAAMSRWVKPEYAKYWIALDGEGQPQGRFHSTSALSHTVVLHLVRALLPEIFNLQLVSWNRATTRQRIEAATFKPFTPLMCARLGIHAPQQEQRPEGPPPVEGLSPSYQKPSRIERWAGKLQKRFEHAGGGL